MKNSLTGHDRAMILCEALKEVSLTLQIPDNRAQAETETTAQAGNIGARK